MSYRSFKKLLHMLTPYLQVKAKQSFCCNWGMEYVSPQLVLHCLLWYLAGGSHLDIGIVAGVANSTFCVCVHQGMNAVLKCPYLEIHSVLKMLG
jgi:hypothetical protein